MSGARKPMEVNLAVTGGKHWTKAEIEERQQSELHLDRPEKLACPSWLSPPAKKIFKAYAAQILASTLPVSELDIGTLARLADAEYQYQIAAKARDKAISGETPDIEGYAFWCKAIASYEKIARNAANDLGCTISSRCRMVVPRAQEEEADPLEELWRRFGVV